MSLTLILGASRSGTSMVANLCQANGAWMGEVTMSEHDRYDQYENKSFRQFCRNMLGIDSDLPKAGMFIKFREFFDSLPTDTESVVLKYPKAFMLLPFLRSRFGLTPKTIYVLRNPWKRGISQTQKDNPTFTQSLAEWEGAYDTMTLHTKGLPFHVAMFERFFIDPEGETRRMIDFIGLKPKLVDTSCIDDTKRSA